MKLPMIVLRTATSQPEVIPEGDDPVGDDPVGDEIDEPYYQLHVDGIKVNLIPQGDDSLYP